MSFRSALVACALLARGASCVRPTSLGEGQVRGGSADPRKTTSESKQEERTLDAILQALLKLSYDSKLEGGKESDKVLKKNIHAFMQHLKNKAGAGALISENSLVASSGVLPDAADLSQESMFERGTNLTEPTESTKVVETIESTKVTEPLKSTNVSEPLESTKVDKPPESTQATKAGTKATKPFESTAMEEWAKQKKLLLENASAEGGDLRHKASSAQVIAQEEARELRELLRGLLEDFPVDEKEVEAAYEAKIGEHLQKIMGKLEGHSANAEDA